MKAVVRVVVLSTVLVPAAYGSGKVIYGEDNRLEVFEAPVHQQIWARSAATMIPGSEIKPSKTIPGMLELNQTTLKQWIESESKSLIKNLLSPATQKMANEGLTFCEGTKFVDQPNPGLCSGFLIAPDLLVTAGHCVAVENFCKDFKWVFDFQVNEASKTAGTEVRPEDVYKCKKVVSVALSTVLGLDYGVIQLDRRVTDRAPLKFRNSAKIADAEGLVVIGSPSGLPLKVAGGANVRDNRHPFYFSSNLDTFQGNSGSAVFNSTTGVVEGILVRGEDDYRANVQSMCIEANMCGENDCRGEDVSRMHSIPEVAIQKALYTAAISGNEADLDSLLKLRFWVDFYGADGQSALIKAAAAGKVASIKKLIAKGADVNLQDAEGNSALHLAAKLNNAELIKVLVGAGAKGDLRNANGIPAL